MEPVLVMTVLMLARPLLLAPLKDATVVLQHRLVAVVVNLFRLVVLRALDALRAL